MLRSPAVAGQFYPGSEVSLVKTLNDLIPDIQPEEKKEALAVISPHAGYVYSGGVAGETIGSVKVPKNVIILGPNHTGYGASVALMDQGAWDFNPLYLTPNDFWSYPSGHTTSAFALSTTLAESVKADWLKVLCYVPAFTTAFARIYENKHWASDVFAGAFIGYFVAKFFTDLHKKDDIIPHEEPPTPLINFSIPF